jgi:hypothetical protein
MNLGDLTVDMRGLARLTGTSLSMEGLDFRRAHSALSLRGR